MKLMSKICLTIVVMSSLLSFVPYPVMADTATKNAIQCGVNGAAGANDCNAQPTTSLDTTIHNIVNVLSVLVGVVAVIMLIIGGLRYITSAGNQEGAKSARNTILY